MMYFKVIMEGGHMGAGRSCEMLRYYEVDNAMILHRFLQNYPALKSKNSGLGIKLIEPISKEQYEHGKQQEKRDPIVKRRTVRFNIVEICRLEPASAGTGGPEAIDGLTIDYSPKGIGVKCACSDIARGATFYLTVESIGIFRKEVKVAWSRTDDGRETILGLRWR